MRAGGGYEISPVTDQVRMPIIPDNDRIWASLGATWQVFRGLHFDLAYSHIWVKDPSMNISAAGTAQKRKAEGSPTGASWKRSVAVPTVTRSRKHW